MPLSIHGKNNEECEDFGNKLTEYAKKNNPLKGKIIKNMQFYKRVNPPCQVINRDPKYNFENYLYEKNLQDI